MKLGARTADSSRTPVPDGAALEREIDALYQQPLAAFTQARNDLAASLRRAGARDHAARVKALVKPPAVAWAVNQVFWQARSIWDRLRAAGDAVRAAQIAALETHGLAPAQADRGRAAMREATAAHDRALRDAVHQAVRLAGPSNADQLARMLEALSLAAPSTIEPGRCTAVVQPAGLEALYGVAPATPPIATREATRPTREATRTGATITPHRPRDTVRTSGRDAEAAAARQARVAAATEAVARARAAARAAADDERRAADAVHDAELRVTQAKAVLHTAQSAARTTAALRDDAERTLAQLTGRG